MKVAMLAIVLLVASVIVLIFANTLNSWVLGGLIGGLAALLISIPVSLVIFTALARRHDERLFAQMAEQEDAANYEVEGDQYDEVYEAEAYVVPQQEEMYYLEDEYYDEDQYYYEDERQNRVQDMRRLPAPGPARQSAYVSPHLKQENRGTGHQRQPRTPQTTRSLRSQQHSAALRAALREAEQDHIDQGEQSGYRQRPVTPRRQLEPKPRLHRSDLEQASPPGERPHTRRPPSQPNNNADYRPQRRTGDLRSNTRQDEQSRQNPITGPVPWNPETGKIVRAPQLGEVYDPTETWTGALNNPIVRRAPYLYEDDPLHEHFAQQVEKPIARRSSRYLHPQPQEEE